MLELDALLDRVRHCGYRVTRQRAVILGALCELDGHAGAEQIHERIQGQGHDVDLSTVYRTLERLRDARVVSQTDLGRGCAEYEIVTGQPHHHLICQGCGQVVDLAHEYLQPVAETIRHDLGFEPVFDHFAIFGRCEACRTKESGQQAGPEA